MRFLSLFSGIEAASVAWCPIGWEAVAFAETDPFASAVLAHHYPAVPNRGDVTRYQGWPDATVDVVVGGSPCQSFSVAGLRKGLADPRGNLALVYLAVVGRYRPRWVVWENVPGVLSADQGRAFGAFLGGLATLGYGWAYRVLDAQYFGLAQRRKRVFVVGCLGDWRGAASVLLEQSGLRGDPAPSRKAWQSVAPILAAHTRGGGGLGTDAECDGAPIPEVSPALKARDYKGPSSDGDGDGAPLIPCVVTHTLRADGFDASEDGTGRGVPLAAVAFTVNDSGADAGEIAPTLRAGGHDTSHANGGVMPAVMCEPFTLAIRGRGDSSDCESRQDGLVNALLTPNGGRGGIGVGAVATLSAVRRLTPRECARLQGFPDDYLNIIYRGKPATDGHKYRALGNSFAVPVVAWIGKRVQAWHARCQR